jgi:aspartyl-tRNA(Asn)/glutamyl-tRNA(Gln) amidotransferase subunit B
VAERAGLLAEPTNVDELEQWCREAIAGNEKARVEFVTGKESAINAFKGPVMKASRGKADPKLVDVTLRRLLAGG